MEPEKILDEIRQLPPEAQKEVTDFIGFLKMRHRKERKYEKAHHRNRFFQGTICRDLGRQG